MVSFPPDFLIERRAIIADKINGENTIGVEDARGGGVFQMMARSVNEDGKVSSIAAVRNFQVLE